jgi:hypothetical protein
MTLSKNLSKSDSNIRINTMIIVEVENMTANFFVVSQRLISMVGN